MAGIPKYSNRNTCEGSARSFQDISSYMGLNNSNISYTLSFYSAMIITSKNEQNLCFYLRTKKKNVEYFPYLKILKLLIFETLKNSIKCYLLKESSAYLFLCCNLKLIAAVP